MWKKKQNDSDESGIRIPEGPGPQHGAGPDGPPQGGVYVESARKKARHQIVFTAVLVIALFAGMTAYFCHYAVANRRTLFDNDYNSRDALLEQHNRRGKILAAGGETLAESDENNNRSYPYGNTFCHVVGYSILGGSGIEEYMKYELLHSDIPFASKLECDRNEELYPGNDVYTTLDVELQEYCYEELGENRGAVLVTEPSTGKILAMVSFASSMKSSMSLVASFLS